MKTIGVIGGMSWESTTEYYRFLNQAVRSRMGGYHSARLLISSVDFSGIETRMREDRWDEVSDLMVQEALRLQKSGAEMILLATNSVHHIAPAIEEALSIPFLHIADATAQAVLSADLDTVGLLGTRFTMEKAFLRDRLKAKAITALVPDEFDRRDIHRIIFDELVHGQFTPESRRIYLEAMERLRERGAQGIILGCTEIGLLVKPEHSDLHLFDTAKIHAEFAVELSIGY